MPLESATYISDLNVSNPAVGDNISQGDDHFRLVKSVLKNTFTNLTGAVTATQAQINSLVTGIIGFADGGATTPSFFFNNETTLGLYRIAAGKLGISTGKVLRGRGVREAGEMLYFPKAPTKMASGGTWTGNANEITCVECDGTVYNMSDFPDLGAFLGSTFGGNGTTTFGMPDLKTAGRFVRSRTGSLAVGTSQADVIKNHVHTFTGTGTAASAGSHNHGGTATTDSQGDHQHLLFRNSGAGGALTGANNPHVSNDPSNVNAYSIQGGSGTPTLGLSNTAGAHTHTATITSDGAHTHSVTVTGTTDNNTGGDATETRPVAFAAIVALAT